MKLPLSVRFFLLQAIRAAGFASFQTSASAAIFARRSMSVASAVQHAVHGGRRLLKRRAEKMSDEFARSLREDKVERFLIEFESRESGVCGVIADGGYRH